MGGRIRSGGLPGWWIAVWVWPQTVAVTLSVAVAVLLQTGILMGVGLRGLRLLAIGIRSKANPVAGPVAIELVADARVWVLRRRGTIGIGAVAMAVADAISVGVFDGAWIGGFTGSSTIGIGSWAGAVAGAVSIQAFF